MKFRVAGLLLTSALVLVLLGSLFLGLRAPEDGWELIAAGAPPVEDARVRVEVLNAAGVAGLARETPELLRAAGFDVVYYGNAGSRVPDSTVVLDRGRNTEAAIRVAAALGIEHILLEPDTALYLEATVILGPGFQTPE
ncbi:MAG: LytR C-terminal domain-containing protein [Gemmatimonadota bacterium]|jgi:hypothetical protein|nr:LytR C-terminal domain-containing protein [Gemmatimonadota bacterium]